MAMDLSRHPCFTEGACGSHGRIHLPVARGCNVQCKFCNRKYDCVNESRPGVTSSVLSPGQAMEYLKQARERVHDIAVVGIAGPGDPFVAPETTMDTLRRVRADDPNVLLCVATNGLNAAPYVKEMAELDVSHLTVTVCGVDPEIVGQVYSWVRHERKVHRGRAAGEIMLRQQLRTINEAKKHHLLVKVNCIVIPGVNEHHVIDVARHMKELGVDLFNAMALCHVPGSAFENITPPSDKTMTFIQSECETYLPQMRHCQRCRADAVGKLHEDRSAELAPIIQHLASGPIEPEQERPYVAVASREGFFVNQHLGEARELMIFAPAEDGDGFERVDMRITPPRGGGDARWEKLADILHDCRALLVSGVGRNPQDVLTGEGITVVAMEGLIEEGLNAIYHEQPIRSPVRCTTCGASCAGDGAGCGA